MRWMCEGVLVNLSLSLQCVKLFLTMVSRVRKDESLQLVLTLLSDITEVREQLLSLPTVTKQQ